MSRSLPIDEIREELADALQARSPRILLKAPTGSGKSTRVPCFLMEEGWSDGGLVLVVQPRRIAARLLAGYVARQMGGEVGDEVGYVVRFDRCMSSKTRIVYVTDGVLQRWLMADNLKLDGVSAVIFDEFHERGLSGDLCLGRVLDLQETERPDLAVVVMSATIEMKGLKDYLGDNCRILEAGGRQYPVEIEYQPPKTSADRRGITTPQPIWEQAVDAVQSSAGRDDCGDILVFMPGVYEIRRTVELLESKSWMKGREVYALHGSLSPEQQNLAVSMGKVPRVIVSTNVAETSLTIEGVRTVIDSGFVRRAGWDARRGMNTLFVEKISRSSADQRTGRAGRLAPGRCIRMWSQADQARRAEFEVPEVLRIDLSEAVLILKLWKTGDVQQFRWIDIPPHDVIRRALSLLHILEAVDADDVLTETGYEMLKFPLEPRLSRLLVSGGDSDCLSEAAAIASLLQGESIETKNGLHETFREKSDYSDFQAEWRAVLKARDLNYDPKACNQLGIMGRAAREILATYRQIGGIAANRRSGGSLPMPDFEMYPDRVAVLLLHSFSDHVGVRNGIAANTCRMEGGKGGRLASGTVAMKGMHFVACEVAEIGGKGVETKVSRCTLIDPDTLRSCFPADFTSADVPVFDESRKRVMLRRRTVFRDLVLEDSDKGDASPDQAAMILAEKIIDGTLRLNKWDDSVDQWIRRLNGVAKWMPELEMPSFYEEDRLVAFGMLCDGAVGYKDIRDKEVMPILKEWLSGWQLDALDRYAPVSIKLANGLQAKVRYEEDFTPVIAMTVQRLFGVRETPLIMDGRCPVKVQVLAPNQRPWQVTSSLASFWENGYPAMRKDLAGRYPRHKWPEKSSDAL